MSTSWAVASPHVETPPNSRNKYQVGECST